jgi:signal transduction histidine kinase
MDRLIYDLLDCARIDLGTFKLNVYESNITALLHEAIETMLPLANDKNVKLELTIQESLPSPHFDGPRLIQVLCNLIGNSIKFSPRNSTITLVATLEGNEIVFRIKDQGPGISPQEKKQLFETFWQKPDTAHLGIGLGLYISKKIIEAHGGRIGLENHSQVGSTFYFTIPSNQEISKLTAA